MKVPFSPPRFDQKLVEAVTDTLRSGWITTGPKTKEFENRINAYCGSKRVLCVNAATAGLELMLRWYGVKEGDEVILPAYTYAATANVVVHCGAKPVFVDVNKDDFNISVEAVKKAINKKTKVIMPVDFGGFPCDYKEINALVDSEEVKRLFIPGNEEQKKLGRILVLADAAHSVGAVYEGKRTGSLCDATVFSFHAVKNLSTAEGGAICLNFPDAFDQDKIYESLCIKSLHGQNKDALTKVGSGKWRYDIVEAGYKCNMTDIMASIGMVELERYERETLIKRRKIVELYNALFKNCSWAEIPLHETENKTSSFHLYPLRIKGASETQRDQIIDEMYQAEVAVNVHFVPVPMMSFYKNMNYDINDYPVAFDNYSREISLPVYFDLSEAQINFVVENLCTAVEKILNA